MKNICYYNNKKYICINKDLINNSKIQIKENKNINNIYKSWSYQYEFINKLKEFQKKYKSKFITEDNLFNKCHICNKKFKHPEIYIYKKFIYSSNLLHYIKHHNYRPSHVFILFVLNKNLNKIGYYIKINQNQLQLFDALLTQGGYEKKFKEKHEKNYRNTEYLGYLKFICERNKKCKLKNIKILNTTYNETTDKTIFIPSVEIKEASNQNYMFHTHPPTPKVGGRASAGIIYEFPSSSDIINFMYLYNKQQKIIGSIVVSPEGIYIIKNISRHKYIYKTMDDYVKISNIISKLIKNELLNSYDKYEDTFTTEFFYNIIAQNNEFITRLNIELKQFNIIISYYPKQQNKMNNWVYGSMYLEFYN
jgi:hypothetical protein